ncbi:MAG: tRNA (adenosine(37)-N6)-threonylcarbamoyltransferase complex dimerization subunit type 1 TsaB [Pseudomonadota bacterium]|nr:tRNA (adenosine(37)-N6)-threonylcarbamoyltransferase complex dimerization subunit type 1 TsaB [Pseudomonadota bacterium]
MRVLAFDTSSPWCSVALSHEGGWFEHEEEVGQAHSERLLPIVRQLLARARCAISQLDGIAFGAGPGSFTGVRIACSVAQGLALGLERPAVPVCTLEAMAQHAWREHHIERPYVCTDARMGEVYVAAYERTQDGWREWLTPAVMKPIAVPPMPHVRDWTGCGNGFEAYPQLASALDIATVCNDVRATGRAIAELALPRFAAGSAVTAEEALPLYVRHRVALTSAEREAGLRL